MGRKEGWRRKGDIINRELEEKKDKEAMLKEGCETRKESRGSRRDEDLTFEERRLR